MIYPARYTFVHPLLRFRRERLLETEGEVVGQRGKAVTPVQVVVRSPNRREYQMIAAHEALRVTPSEVGEFLLVDPGAPVEMGMPLARRKQFMGAREVVSPVDGVLLGLKNGHLIVEEISQWDELRAGVNGRIVNQIDNRGVELELNGALIQANWSNKLEDSGILRMAATAPDASFTVSQIDGNIMGHILVIGRADQADALESVANIGLRGLVAASIPVHLLPLVKQFDFPVFLTEGIGNQSMARPIFELLSELSEREATLLARHQDRPEIIVTLDTPAEAEERNLFKPLRVGQLVRVLQISYASQIGQISRLYEQAVVTQSGVRARGADVTLVSGTTIFVPYSNLDALIQD